MRPTAVEWPTLLVFVLCYLVWAVATTIVAAVWLPAGIVLAALATALFSSLTHEVTHGHPFRNERLNAALVFPALSLVIPFGRFRDTHLDHHRDAHLTDPFDDPESNFLAPEVWHRLPRWVQGVLNVNNTLLGRILIGPVVGQIAFVLGDIRLARQGDDRVLGAWLLHPLALIPVVLWFVLVADMPFWAYAIAAYASISILKIRTFLEHRAHDRASGRTVVIEDRGILSFLFLNNNLHVVHHVHPRVAWYRLPALYAARRQHYLTRNGGYRYGSYGEVFRRHFLRAKDPVPHPLRPAPAAVSADQPAPARHDPPAGAGLAAGPLPVMDAQR